MNTIAKIALVIIIAVLAFLTESGAGKISYGGMQFFVKDKADSILPKKVNIYLTIDDGPSPASFFLSNIAIKDSGYFTMFVIGDSVFQNKSNTIFYDLYQLNPFIEIGNHSYSHANGHYRRYYENASQVIEDFCKNADTLHISNKIARLPGRNTWRIGGRKKTDLPDDSASANGLMLKGYRVFGWDIEWKCKGDSSQNIYNAGNVVAAIAKMARNKNSFTPGNIVLLCHESMFVTSENKIQFETFLKEIKENPQYQMKTLRWYPAGDNQLAN